MAAISPTPKSSNWPRQAAWRRSWQKPAAKRSKAESDELFDFWLRREDKPYQDLTAGWPRLEKEQMAIRARGTVAHVMQERAEPPKAYVLFRGDYDKRREEVKPATPAFLPPMPADLPRNRLGFAHWLLRPEHPLTARVTVNRFWQEVFGTGLVKTTEDFGVNGETPVNPGVARLAGGRFPRVGLGREAVVPLDGHVGRLSAVGRGDAREARTRPAEPLALARPALPHGRRDGPRLCPGGQRPAGGEDRRAERAALSARRRLGGGGHAGEQHAVLSRRQRREPVSAEHVHASGSGLPRRHRWTSSTRPRGKRAPCGASGPTRRCRPW